MNKNFKHDKFLSSGAFKDVYKGTPIKGSNLLVVKSIKHEVEEGKANFLAKANNLNPPLKSLSTMRVVRSKGRLLLGL